MNKTIFQEKILPVNLIQDIKEYVNKERPQTTNYSFWDKTIIRDSARVDIFHLSDTPFKAEVIKCFENYVDINKYSTSYVNYYKWLPGSFIPFHTDGFYRLSSTIYLNEHWDKDYGGLFLYEKNNEIRGFVPKYNHAVINTNTLWHSTSIISANAPKRETLQIFFK
jgi:Rps23 Pro-64 3,4-dihydroxylase Tpa1-like proline 4-hydroxylase|tara:strand:- start:75 stop:572 length:498 start_codon:yes stop_codon:yes gene_type:complete